MPRIRIAGSCLVALAWAWVGPLAGQGGTTATARSLLAAMQAESTFIHGMEVTIPIQKQASPKVPEVFWERMLQRAREGAPALLDSLAPVYAERFSEAELQELLRFYRSPIGRRFTALQLDLSEASSQVGRRWGARLGADVAKELVDEGVEFQ